MAMGVPIVSTSVGAEGLPVVEGENILVADDPQSFANETFDLLTNSARAKSISDSALSIVREHYSWKAVSQVFESHCFTLLQWTLESNNAS
jgi:glycosyltransferase involved in cell wall biosynthesis